MKKMISLIKVDLNNTFGLSSMLHNFKIKKNRWQPIVIGIALLSFIPTYIVLIKGLNNIYDAYNQLGQTSYFLQMGILASQAIVFFLGIIYVISKYYFSNDLNQLVPLPIKPSYIFGSKFITLMISEYLTSLPIILPFVLIYGIKGGEKLLYWIYSFFLILGIPVLPLILSSTLVMVFMKYTNIKGKKDLLRIIGFTIMIIGLLFIQIKIQGIIQKALDGGENFYLELIQDSNLLVKRLGMIFPPSIWATLSLASYQSLSGLAYLISFLLTSAFGYFVMIFLSERLFFDGLIGNMEIDSSRKKGKDSIDFEKRTRMNKPYISLVKKEIIMLFKTPIYLFNSLGAVVIIPMLIFIHSLTGDESIKVLIKALENHPEYISLGVLGMIIILGVLNSIGSTTFSREGKNLWIQRTLPIPAEAQIVGRILSSLVVQAIGIIILITVSLLLVNINFNFINILIIIGLGLLGSIPVTQIGMIIDIMRPLLIWDNPQKAMKQNLNVLINMGIGILYTGSLGYMAIKLLDKISVNYIYLILTIVFIASAYVLFIVLRKLITKQFVELE